MGNVNNITLIITLIISILIFIVPRRHVIILILAAACYLPLFAQLNIASLNFSMLRLIIAASWIRFLLRNEISLIKFNKIDRVIVLFLISSIITYTMFRQSSEAFINRLGMAYDVAGSYFLFRIIQNDMDDIIRTFKILAVLVIPIAIAMIIERITEANVFSVFGSPLALEGYVRDGKIRCLGPFSHPVLAGSFGAICTSFFCCLLYNKNYKYAVLGIVASMFIVWTSNSSGPLMATLAVIIGLIMWNIRNHMRIVRWTLFCSIVAMHFVMKAPVWFLIGKLGLVIGGGGWHRSEIIDAAIKHFDEWWLLGTIKTRHWMPTGVNNDPEATDITNQFVKIGVDGGLITLCVFIYLLVLCFSVLGKALKNIPEENKAAKLTVWTIGVALFAHIVTFFSVSYFDQNTLFFYLVIAIIVFINIFYNKASADKQMPLLSGSKDVLR